MPHVTDPHSHDPAIKTKIQTKTKTQTFPQKVHVFIVCEWCRPLSRKSLTRQLNKLTRQPSKPSKNALLSFGLGAAKLLLQGGAVYVAVTLLQGRKGKQRLEEDFHAVAVRLRDPQYSVLAPCSL